MQNSSNTGTRSSLILSLFLLGLVTALVVLPSQFVSEAVVKGEGLNPRTESHKEGLPNYDIREPQKSDEVTDALAKFRNSSGKDASAIAATREDFVRGEEELRGRVPTLKIEYNDDIRIPEVIGPDVSKGRNFLTSASGSSRVDILRNFVKENNSLIGVTDEQANSLKVLSDYTNPDGNLSYTHLEQRINGIPVFRGEVKAGFTKNGEMIRVINNLAPGLDYESLSTDFRDPSDAVKSAARHSNVNLSKIDMGRNESASSDLKTVFGRGDWATTAEKMYFPTEPGVARAAWRVLIWQPIDVYYVIVDAETGTMLWRKNITEDQTQPATYNVYRNATAMIDGADSSNPLTPGPIDPALGTQGPRISRTLMTRIGNEAPYTFNNNGWITDGANLTDGNAVEAGLDRDTTNGVDATSIPVGSPNRTFNFPFGATDNPGNPVDNTGETPSPNTPTPCVAAPPAYTDYQRASAVQMFWMMNLYHDEMYRLGWTEQAFNFQTDNFGRGGVGADRLSAEGQDCSGTNNANMATPADGARPRMQMFLWTGPTPDFDGTIDGDVLFHEVTHGLSNRLHGNSAGLSTNMARGMGEGWSDFYAHTMLSTPTDPQNGIYTTGGYATYLIAAGFTGNYYYGIRRYPKAVLAFTGGINNRPHNAYTFRDINSDCNTRLNNTNFAFARGPIGVTQCDQVHNIGEIWSSALWEVRDRFIQRLGAAAGNRKTVQLVTDGMKLAPLAPTLLTERDAIIAAALASSAAPEAVVDVTDVREGFRLRGMGFSASIQSISPAAVTEAFDGWTLASNTPAVTSGNNLLEPNECNTLNVPVTNNGGATATGITAVLSSSTPGITVTQPNSAYPDVPAGGGPVNNTTPYQVSIDNTVACFTTANFTLTVSFSGGGGGSPVVTNFSLPVGIPGGTYAFASGTGAAIPAGGTLVAGSQADDAAVAIPLPSGWTSTLYDVPVTSLSASTNGLITANATTATTFGNTALPAAAGTTNPTMAVLWDDMIMTTANVTGGGIFVNTVGTAPNRQLIIEWRAQHFDETVNGPITINIAAVLNEGSSQIQYRYVTTGIAPNQNGASGTVGVQRQATGTQFTQHSFNQAVIMPGMTLTGTLPAGQCTPGPGGCSAVTVRSRADFDGDGRTDLSVFRASEGNWYLNRSTAGFQVLNWGISTDVLTPGDFDGDGKADTAIFRATADSSQPDFYILNSNGFTLSGVSWGLAADIPVMADYDGDNRTDVAVYRPSTNTWFVLNSGGGVTIRQYGLAGDVPVAGDFVGDSRADITIFRPSTNQWWVFNGGGDTVTTFGSSGDILVPADYSGDNKDDIAIFRPSTGQWIYLPSSGGGAVFANWGASGDVPVPGDYDGDGRDDFAIYRGGQWWLLRSTSGVSVQNFGLGTDTAIPRSYVP